MSLTPHEIIVLLLSLGVLLRLARVLGELARKIGQPTLLGEILAGILLGPTVLGQLSPAIAQFLFPTQGNNAVILEGFKTLSVVLFLLVAGLEVDLSMIRRQGRAALHVSILGILFPFALGFVCAWFFPHAFGSSSAGSSNIFPFFFAIALSISALPVIAKTLIDLNLYRTELGMITIAAAIFDDLVGWILFALLLSFIGTASQHHFSILHTLFMTLGFTIFMLTGARWFFHWAFPRLKSFLYRPGGMLGFVSSLALLGAAFTEWIGIHAVFGSFLVGVALGDSPHLEKEVRSTLNDFVTFVLAPLFFATIGLRVNFLAHFDGGLLLKVLAIACVGKLLGCSVGAYLGKRSWRESLAIGFAMNSRGAMEIILGLLALQYQMIDERLFVALVGMALATSVISGPMMGRLMRFERS